MDFLNVAASLGPVAGTVIVVLLFIRFATAYMKSERCHREKLAEECHAVQTKATEATFKAVESIDRSAKIMEKVNITPIRLNGGPR